MSRLVEFAVVVSVILTTATLFSETLNVPQDHLTIQQAIDAAAGGDEILVDAGTYSEALDLLGKEITLVSAAGPELTVLDGSGLGMSVVRCESGETLNTWIIGFTFTGGEGTSGAHCTGVGQANGIFGGAIYVSNSSLQVLDCTFQNNGGSVLSGAAIFSEGGDLVVESCSFLGNGDPELVSYGGSISLCGLTGTLSVTDCTFQGNGAGFGGGIYSDCRNATITDCFFFDNEAAFGGGISVSNGTECAGGLGFGPPSESVVTGCTFVGNEGSFGGGSSVVAGEQGTVRMEGCSYTGNVASGGGGAHVVVAAAGLGGPQGHVIIDDAFFTDNEATHGGGLELLISEAGRLDVSNVQLIANRAVGTGTATLGGGFFGFVTSGEVTITNAEVIGNTSGHAGAGLAVSIGGGFVDITNATIVDNVSGNAFGGISAASGGGPITISNVIVRGNEPEEMATSGPVSVLHSNIEGLFPGTNITDVDPLFVDPAAGDYRLGEGSPCIDAGDSTALPAGIVLDVLGQPRFFDDPSTPDTGIPVGGDPVVDLGAFEYQGPPTPGGTYRRGDANGDALVNALTDPIHLLLYGFAGGSEPPCLEAADSDDSGVVDPIIDAIYLLAFGFAAGSPPPVPYPDCGVDPSPTLGCGAPPGMCL